MHGYYGGKTLNFLYSASYYCDTSVPAESATGCEAGARYSHRPSSAASQDPLYILVPLGFKPAGLQCATQGNCIDHPPTMDLTRLSPVLDPIPAHHARRVTSQASYDKAVAAKSYSALKSMEGSGGVTKEIPTNAILYLQTLAGSGGAALDACHGVRIRAHLPWTLIAGCQG